MLEKLRNNRQEIFVYSALLVLCSIPFNHAYITTSTIIFVVFNMLSIKSWKLIEVRKTYLFLLLFFVLASASMLWTDNLSMSIIAWSRMISLGMIPIVLLFAPKIDKSHFFKIWRWFSYYLILLFISFILLAFMRWRISHDTSEFFYHTLVSPLELNAIYVSYLVSSCILVGVAIPHKSYINYVVLGVLFLFLILLSSKLVSILTALGIGYQLLARSKNKFRIGLITVATVVIVFISPPVFDRFLTEFNSNYVEILERDEFTPIYDWKGGTIRLLLSRVGVEILNKKGSWPLGVGLGASQPHIEENLKSKNLYYDFWDYNFHNQYMQVLVELGIVGLLLLLCIYLSMIIPFRKNAMVLSIFILIACWGITESFLWRQRGLILFLILISTIYQTNFRAHKIT